MPGGHGEQVLHSRLALTPSLQQSGSCPHPQLGRAAGAQLPVQAVTAQPYQRLLLQQKQATRLARHWQHSREAAVACWGPQVQLPQAPQAPQKTPQLGRPPGAAQAQPCQRWVSQQKQATALARHWQHSEVAAVAWQCLTVQVLPTAQGMRLMGRGPLQRPRHSLATQLPSSATHSYMKSECSCMPVCQHAQGASRFCLDAEMLGSYTSPAGLAQSDQPPSLSALCLGSAPLCDFAHLASPACLSACLSVRDAHSILLHRLHAPALASGASNLARVASLAPCKSSARPSLPCTVCTLHTGKFSLK